MPNAPKRPCREPGCPALVDSGRCPTHQRKRYRQQDANRESAAKRGYDAAWQPVRIAAFVRDAWQCVDCGWEPMIVTAFREAGEGLPSTAAVLESLRIRQRRGERHLHGDHIETIEDRPDLRLDVGNIATRCNVCHNRKTMRDSVAPMSTG